MASLGQRANLQALAERKIDAQQGFSMALSELLRKHRELAVAEYDWSAGVLSAAGMTQDGPQQRAERNRRTA